MHLRICRIGCSYVGHLGQVNRKSYFQRVLKTQD